MGDPADRVISVPREGMATVELDMAARVVVSVPT